MATKSDISIDKIALIKQYYDKGFVIRAIAEKTGVSKHFVERAIKENLVK